MSRFNESNTVETLIRDLLCGALPKTPQRVGEGSANVPGTAPAVSG